jgi:mannose-6-phosphate isomerase-like protein (cupin superfamily)
MSTPAPLDHPSPTRAAAYYEFNAQHAAAASTGSLSPGWRVPGTEHSWTVRSQNCVVSVSWLDAGESLTYKAIPDEVALLVTDACAVTVSSGSGPAQEVVGPAFVIVPAGDSVVTGKVAGFVTRVCTTRADEAVKQASNAAAYTSPSPLVVPLPGEAGRPKHSEVRVHPLTGVEEPAPRVGRVFRTDSLMVSWFEPTTGPADVDHLVIRTHPDREQVVVTLAGDFVHHVRSPWTERLSEWRADDHVLVTSPSVTVIPPGAVHATRAVGDDVHQLIEVFAPPVAEFIEHGWVINQTDYET